MIVKKIIIVDDSNKDAGEFIFDKGANLLVSADNSQGKSSLVKSLYYGLGLDIRRFPAHWNPKGMSIKIELHNPESGEDLYVLRRNDLFYVSDGKEPLDIQEYTKWISKKLNIDLKLTLKSTKRLSSVSRPSAIITPFYVDQDESWSGRIYSATNEVGMYAETPERIFDYLLKITDDNDLKAKEKLSQLKSDLNAFTAKRANINEVYMDYVNEDDSSVIIGITNNLEPAVAAEQDIKALTNLMDNANRRYREYKALRIKLQRDLDQKRKNLEEYRDVLSMYKKDFKIIEGACKHCKSELTEELVKTRLEVTSNIYDLKYLIDVTDKEVLEINSRISQSNKDEDTAYQEYLKISNEISLVPEFSTIQEYINIASTKKSQNEFATIIQTLDSRIGSTEAKITELKQERKDAVKAAAELTRKIDSRYSEFVSRLSIIMRGSNVHDRAFRDFSAPKSSGVNDNQVYLGIYLAYMRLISEFGKYQLPFCIDSFLKNETSDEKQDAMFEATGEFLLGMNGQSIFTAIESSVDRFMKRSSEFHKVRIGDRLLSQEKYDTLASEVNQVMKI